MNQMINNIGYKQVKYDEQVIIKNIYKNQKMNKLEL